MGEKPKMEDWKALDRTVLAVAVEGYGQLWTAYIGSVPGKNHDKEWREVRANGSKLDKKLAELLFPSFRDSGLAYRE